MVSMKSRRDKGGMELASCRQCHACCILNHATDIRSNQGGGQTVASMTSAAGKVLSLSCSPRVMILAMSAQIMAYDLATLTVSYSAITQPAPTLYQAGEQEVRGVPLALGARWLAHASNQVMPDITHTFQCLPNHALSKFPNGQYVISQTACLVVQDVKIKLADLSFDVLPY